MLRRISPAPSSHPKGELLGGISPPVRSKDTLAPRRSELSILCAAIRANFPLPQRGSVLATESGYAMFDALPGAVTFQDARFFYATSRHPNNAPGKKPTKPPMASVYTHAVYGTHNCGWQLMG